MSVATPSTLVDLSAVESCVAEIGAAQEECALLFRDVFDQIEGLARQLALREQASEATYRATQAELERRREELAREQAEIKRREEEVRRERAEQARSQPAVIEGEAAAVGEGLRAMGQALAAAETERHAMQAAMNQTLTEVARLGEALDRLASGEGPWTAVQNEIRSQQAGLQAAVEQTLRRPEPDGLHERLASIEKQLAESERERAVLETELEAVRHRAAEMTESLQAERRHSSEERTLWTAELQRLRRFVEGRASPQAADDSAPATVPMVRSGAGRGESAGTNGGSRAASASAAPSASDPLIDSVQAQFDLLRKDMARRRKSAAAT